MHLLRRTNNRIDGAGLYAKCAAYAKGFINNRNRAFALSAATGIECDHRLIQ
jgi:hypothetical protein